MGYNPEKTNANTSGNKPPKKPASPEQAKKVGSVAVRGATGK